MKVRFFSLDVFRGATVCLMIMVNNPGSWQHAFPPLKHAAWHGATPTDLVFPFFLFAVGNALAFVMPRLEAAGEAAFWKKVLKRTAIIFLIGLFLNWWPFMTWRDDSLVFRYWVDPVNSENGVRILGVLQRIALCYFFASVLIFYLKPRKALLAGLVLLLGYWFFCLPANPADPYSLNGWIGTTIDKKLLGIPHMYKGEGVPFDPEGLLSTIPAIVQVIFGFMVGLHIRKKELSFETLNTLFVAGLALLVTGLAWDLVFPINKKIWTSSYTLYTTGWAILILATLIFLVEFRNLRGPWTRFFDVFGKNALFVFALSAFLPRGLSLFRLENGMDESGQVRYYTPWNWLYQKLLIQLPGDPRIGSFLYALAVILLMWAICWWMDKKKIYVKV